MAIDYAAKEKEFLSELKADTGRDLAQWMAAISAKGFRDKNEAIDWLRGQGFMFWKASWLERVHHNGGRPIYADPASARAHAEIARHLLDDEAPLARIEDGQSGDGLRTPTVADRAATPQPLPPPPTAAAAVPPQVAVLPNSVEPPSSDLGALLAKAKGYRPLAEHVLREVRSALPAARVATRGSLVVLSEKAEFAVLAISARELKLGLALRETPAVAPMVRTRIPGAGDFITHAVVLTDARQVTPALLALIKAAHGLAGN